MSRWGLRWIFCWVSVFITACTQVASPAQTPKPEHMTPIDAFSPTTAPAFTRGPTGTAPPTARLVTNEPVSALVVTEPICYTNPVDSLICLGWLTNNSRTPRYVVDTTIQLSQILGSTQRTLDEQPITSALLIIPPRMRIPYRAIFTDVTAPLTTLATTVNQNVQFESNRIDMTSILLQVTDVDVTSIGAAYEVQGIIRNPSPIEITNIELLATIVDAENRVMGYRVFTFYEYLEQGEKFQFKISVTALAASDRQEIEIYAQGHRHLP